MKRTRCFIDNITALLFSHRVPEYPGGQKQRKPCGLFGSFWHVPQMHGFFTPHISTIRSNAYIISLVYHLNVYFVRNFDLESL